MLLKAVATLLLFAYVVVAQDGYASLNGGTTGGSGGSTIYVSTEDELISAVTGDTPRIVKIRGHIALTKLVRPGSNKTILGADTQAGVSQSGFYIRKQRNVIIRGLRIFKSIAPDDGVSIDASTNVWIDHNEFFSDLTSGKDYYDGLLDVSHAADFVTISWNKFHTHFKTTLVGHSDNNAAEDKGTLRVTIHHNWYLDCNSRLPSIRFGTAHIYNNLYENVETSGINSRMGAQVLVEGNVFSNTKHPLITNLDSSEDGFAVERNNIWGNAAPEITQTGNFTQAPYTFVLDAATSVSAAVKKGAGNTISFP